MRTLVASLAAAAVALAPFTPAAAQEDADPGYTVVTTLEVAPPDRAAFTDAVRTVRDAAEAAGLGAEFRWEIYNRDDTFYFVSWRESMASFDDPEAFMRQFEGTPHAQTIRGAMQSFEKLRVKASSSVSRALPEWSYVPESPAVEAGRHAGVYVISNRIGSASEAAFGESTQGIMRMLGEMGYPYPVYASRVMLGEEAVEFVIPFDTPGNFWGQHSLPAHLEQSGMGEAWESHMRERGSMLLDTESMMAFFMPELSYMPEQATMEGDG